MPPLPPLPLVDGCLFMDHSGWLEPMMTCHRLTGFKQLYLRVPKDESAALTFGSAIHTSFEYRYVKAQNQRPEPWISDDVAVLLQELFDSKPTPEGDWRTLNWAVEIFRRYNERYTIEDFSLLQYDNPIPCPHCEGADKPCSWCSNSRTQPLMVELSFILPLFTYTGPLGTIPILYTGRIDLPVFADGKLFIMDHKTTSILGPQFWDRQRRSSQQRGYCWAFQKLTGRKVSGYIINAVRTKEPPQYVLNGTVSKRSGKTQSPDEWWTESLQRERFYTEQSELEEWENETVGRVEDFLWNYHRGELLSNSESCTKWGKCPYYDVCTMEPSSRLDLLLSGEFAPNTWSPLKKPLSASVSNQEQNETK